MGSALSSFRARIHAWFSGNFWRQFVATRQVEDLTRSYRAMRRAVMDTPEDHPELPYRLGRVAHMLIGHYELSGRVELLDEAIKMSRKAVDKIPAEYDGERLSAILEDLANGLQNRSKRSGNLEDLAESIELSVKAIAAAPKGRLKVLYLNMLGSRLDTRYDLVGRVEDLSEAIKVTEDALQQASGSIVAGTQHNLGILKLKLPDEDIDGENLRQAIGLLETAVHTAENHVIPLWLNSLGSALRARFSREGQNQKDLDRAIACFQYAVDTTPENHINRPMYLHNLAGVLRIQADRERPLPDLSEAVARSQEAEMAMPKSHPARARVLWLDGRLEELRGASESGGVISMVVDGVPWQPAFQDAAMSRYLECLNSQNGTSGHRVVAAAQLMTILQQRGELAHGLEIGQQALQQLHSQNTRSLGLADQERTVSDFSDMAVETCSLSLQAGETASLALEILEVGRGAILGLLIEDRSDISTLASSYPEEAALFEKFRDGVLKPINRDTSPSLLSERDRSVQKLDILLKKIRALPGQERFLRGPAASELMKEAEGGTIVTVTIADRRSDAIIVSNSEIKTVPLPQLTKNEVVKWKKKLAEHNTIKELRMKNNLYTQFLKWLWDVCVAPIFEFANLVHGKEPTGLPRVWWIGAGQAASLPFHAAGVHTPRSTENTYSFAISSYTPTIRALAYAKERSSVLQKLQNPSKPKLLGILMPTTPNDGDDEADDLGAEDELEEIVTVSPNLSVQALLLPSRNDVLNHLSQCDIAHFACHGESDTKSPSNSHLILQRAGPEPDSPPKRDKLTVQQIAEARLGRARIAYLSACSTAENRAQALADEVLHLASGFQVAGFPHVVGALWPTDDEICVQVAKAFYERISTTIPLDDRAVALALQDAVLKVRARKPRQPLLWAPYIHFGA